MRIRTSIAALAISLMAGAAAAQSVAVQAVQVATPGSVQAALRQLGADFAKETGTKVDFVSGSGGSTLNRLKGDAPMDVVALADHELEAMGKAGLIKPETIVIVGSVRVGVAVRAGAPLPDISTVDKLRATLLATKAVSHPNPKGGSTSGAQTARLFEQLGIAKEMAAKTTLAGPKALAAGEVDLHIQPTSELMQASGITIVGPLPAELKVGTTLGVALTSRATSTKDALAFLKYVARPESKKVFLAKGVTPPGHQQ